MRTKTCGIKPPAMSASPLFLRKTLRFIIAFVPLVAGLPGCRVAATWQPGNLATRSSLLLKLRRSEDEAGDHRDLGVVPRIHVRRFTIDDARADRCAGR